MIIRIPGEVKYIIDMLEKNGYEAYAAGGCVRDSLLGKEPQDWDICASALPEQTILCFENHDIIKTGLKHGTVTLMLDNRAFEITTYRADGKYKDNRRPETVKFVNVLKRDLARRDFTVNAMAYNPKTGLIDYYGGQNDLAERKIKCVGNADKRMREDALRIMRALRFASVFEFSIDGDTSAAMHNNKKLLRNISAERIAAELNKMILGGGVNNILSKHIKIIAEIIPELTPANNFIKNYNIETAPKDLIIRLVLLFHDIAECPEISSDISANILTRLKYDNDTVKTVAQLVLYHGSEIKCSKHIKRLLNKIGEERLRQLIEVKRAVATAQTVEIRQEKINNLIEISAFLDEIIEQQQCYSLKDLAVNGRDLLKTGIAEGVQIGIILNKLVDMVIDEKIINDKSVLLEMAKELKL